MNISFKYIVAAIISILIIVFIWQLFWLKNLYNSIEKETETNVINCIELADYEEISLRMDSLDKAPRQNKSISVSKVISSEEDSVSSKRKITTKQESVTEKDTVTTTSTQKKNINMTTLDQMFAEMKITMHHLIDSVAPPNLGRLDSLINVNFDNKAIEASIFKIEMICVNTDSVIRSFQSDSSQAKGLRFFIYIFDSERNIGYKVCTDSLTNTVLVRMSGILITTFLIVVILGFAFWYLIRTVMRLKTLEEMKDDFTNNMTHELKTPIAVAYSATDVLLNYGENYTEEKRRQYLQISKDKLSELTALVEQILSMSMERRRTFMLNKEDVAIEDLINALADQHKLKSGKEVAFDIKIQPANLIIKADRTHLNNIVSNLIDNAIKYSKDKAKIKIEICQKEKYNIITVEDNGIGISSEKQSYIFDKFYRVSNGNQYEVKGYGLGLFYVKTMVEEHGGTISVSSTQGKGSVFTVKIPVQ